MADDNTEAPFKFETGTPAMELAAGAAEAVEFIAEIGRAHEEFFVDKLTGLEGRRRYVVAGMMAIDEYEEGLAVQLRTELAKLPGVKVFGPEEGHPRTSTVSFNMEGVHSNEIARFLAEKGIFVWDGDYYAIETIMNVLKLESSGGLVRIGLAPYNIQSEIDRTLDAVKEFIGSKK
jgi:selenocysteine lyase/cysteine desulfurase